MIPTFDSEALIRFNNVLDTMCKVYKQNNCFASRDYILGELVFSIKFKLEKDQTLEAQFVTDSKIVITYQQISEFELYKFIEACRFVTLVFDKCVYRDRVSYQQLMSIYKLCNQQTMNSEVLDEEIEKVATSIIQVSYPNEVDSKVLTIHGFEVVVRQYRNSISNPQSIHVKIDDKHVVEFNLESYAGFLVDSPVTYAKLVAMGLSNYLQKLQIGNNVDHIPLVNLIRLAFQ
jgi:hypothetical protein